LGGDLELARDAVAAYARAVVEAAPSGKQNTFAAHNLPSVVLVILRKEQGSRNLANAFEVPGTSRNGGLVKASAGHLRAHWQQVGLACGRADSAWVLDLTGAFDGTQGVSKVASLDELVAAVRAAAA